MISKIFIATGIISWICLHMKVGDNKKLLSSVEPTKSKMDCAISFVAVSTWASLFFILFFMNVYIIRDGVFL